MIIRRVSDVMVFDVMLLRFVPRGYGATAARLTPDQKVGSLNLSGLKCLRASGPGPLHLASGICITGISKSPRSVG